nr:MAG TPA: hypothetical protein [Caudoviricetes sp.]
MEGYLFPPGALGIAEEDNGQRRKHRRNPVLLLCHKGAKCRSNM